MVPFNQHAAALHASIVIDAGFSRYARRYLQLFNGGWQVVFGHDYLNMAIEDANGATCPPIQRDLGNPQGMRSVFCETT